MHTSNINCFFLFLSWRLIYFKCVSVCAHLIPIYENEIYLKKNNNYLRTNSYNFCLQKWLEVFKNFNRNRKTMRRVPPRKLQAITKNPQPLVFYFHALFAKLDQIFYFIFWFECVINDYIK